jgi:molybdenum cofactor cytidylyltransferase
VEEGAAIVLAAGVGRRMGGPKVLLEHAGRPLLVQHVAAFAAIRVRSYVVVRPELSARIRALLLGTDAVVVESDAEAQSGSLVRALSELPSHHDAVFVTPVDLLPASATTLSSLHGALRAPYDAVTPSYRGRGGHPVLVRRSLVEALRHVSDPPSLRSVLEAADTERLRLEVDDPHVVGDFDTPQKALHAGVTRPW